MYVHKTVSDDRNFQATLLDIDLNRIVAEIPSDLIEDIQLKGLVIAGGFIRSILRGEPINDIDLFNVTETHRVPEKVSADIFSKAAIFDPIKAEAIQLSKDLNVGTFLTTHNAVSFEVYGHTATKPEADHVKVQYIIKYTSPTVKALLQKFDFTNSMAAIWWDSSKGWVSMCHNGFYGDIGNNTLTFNPNFDGDEVILMKRFVKFVTKGWAYTMLDFAKIIAALNDGEHSDIYKILRTNAYGIY